MQSKPFQIYLGALILIEAILSFFVYTQIRAHKPFCILGNGCNIVQNSAYSSIFGINVSLFGTLCFAALFVLYVWAHNNQQRYRWYLAAVVLGSLVSLYLLILQFFIIKSVCSSCVVIDILMLIIMGLSFYEYGLRKSY